jgi:LPXTG-motif cell wall-anchored protein
MYGNVLGASTVSAGAVLLPNTGSNRTLFYAALVMLVSGLITLAASGLLTIKRRKAEIK